ncbi:hypothetical protein RHMOL_Rhmol12G0040100 [Rhododendron molle]|uniref:Uncharacterized protein n=1 Tax=Rhododendron molle TaxID=49168 RepID=A0ACC0LF02_RHOML|nr:hypothetical protein RHMOL_Rhmol12G0040100 [Rhododendron molle]
MREKEGVRIGERAKKKKKKKKKEAENPKMVKVSTFFAMTLGAFVFWQSMDKIHVWIALHQDEKQERMEREAEIKRFVAHLLVVWKEKSS